MTDKSETKSSMPTIFLPHGGGPCFFMDWNPKDAWDKLANFLKGTLNRLPYKPKGVIVVSAHWLEPTFTVQTNPKPSMYYDYYGFPKHTYELKYEVPGSPELADKVAKLLETEKLPVSRNSKRGYDHGVFVPLLLALPPEHQLPTIQLSLHDSLDAEMHIKAGKALESLRKEGYLIIGSGMSFHNMSAYNNPSYTAKSEKFDQWLTKAVTMSDPQVRNDLLKNWETAPYARECHPPKAEEHLVPLFVCAGAAGSSVGQHSFSDIIMKTKLSGYEFK